MDEEDDEFFGGLYEDGHWVWDEHTQALAFVSDLPPKKVEAIQKSSKAPTGAIEFRDDIDLIEQDVKDTAIYTAPVSILSPILIDMLHLPTTDRFLRALIFYCAYYLQVADKMALRMIECETKRRTNNCEILENEFKNNLSDLRVLLAKEYSMLLIGGGDMKKFHHMGSTKKRRSLTNKDARLYETLMHVSVQIVYLALGRKNYRQIELECHRVFKTDTFNTVEHKYKTGYLAQMTLEERNVLLGTCLLYQKKLNTQSPLMNEIFCERPIDFRMMGLGVIKHEKITDRLHYLYLIVAGPDEKLLESKITVGIIGMRRCLFDTMLHPINASATSSGKSKSTMSTKGMSNYKSMTGKSSLTCRRVYPEIILPPNDPIDPTLPSNFPEEPEDVLHVCQVQRHRWQNRLMRLTSATVL